MIKREELEAALAKAEAEREHLEAVLARAEAALVNTATDAAKIDANRADASANLDRARADCVRARAALREYARSKPTTTSRERGFIQVREVPDEPAPAPVPAPVTVKIGIAGPAPKPAGNLAAGPDNKSERDPGLRNLIRRADDAFARSQLLRQTVGLLALVMAYLQYYFFDVQLQIMSLPSVVTLIAAPVASIS